jgi:hypothetical protein
MINDLPDHIKNSFTIVFVDDSNLLISRPFDQLSLILDKLQSDLNSVHDWMNENRLKLNLCKTVFMVVASPHQLSQLPHIKLQINSTAIKRVSEIKFLGVIFDDGLSWSSHTKKVIRACNCALYSKKTFFFCYFKN